MPTVDTYGPSIQAPVSEQPISASQFGIPARAAIQDLDRRMQGQEANQIISSGVTSAAGFTVSGLEGILLENGLICMLTLGITTTAAITVPSTGNLTDTLMTTLPSILIPSQAWYGSICTNVNSGGVEISPTGQVIIMSWDPAQNIAAGAILRISATYSTLE